MLDYGSSTSVMSLKVMNELGLQTTRPPTNACGIYFEEIKVYELIKDIKIYLASYHDISILMDFVVIGVLDSWGVLFV
jgi:hypothetical protein